MKKATILLLCAVLFLAGALSVLHFGNRTGSDQQEPYDLGLRFLSEGRYEEAILMFDATIKIDPNHASAYFHRAEAYLAMAKNCLDPETALDYLGKAEKDFLKAEILDSSLTAEAEKLLEELKKLQDNAEAAPETTPATTETEPESTTEPTEETKPQGDKTPSSGSSSNSSSGGSNPAHNPKPEVTPGEDASDPMDEPEVDHGEPPVINPDEPPVVDIPGTPEHNPTPDPVDPDDFMPDDDPVVDLGTPDISDPSHSDQVLPDDSVPTDTPVIDNGEPPVDLGSPDIS